MVSASDLETMLCSGLSQPGDHLAMIHQPRLLFEHPAILHHDEIRDAHHVETLSKHAGFVRKISVMWNVETRALCLTNVADRALCQPCGAERRRNGPPHRGFRIKSHTPSGFHVGIANAEAHEAGAGFSAVFRTIPVGWDICRRPGPPAAPARVARDTPEFSEWRLEDESQPRFACAPKRIWHFASMWLDPNFASSLD